MWLSEGWGREWVPCKAARPTLANGRSQSPRVPDTDASSPHTHVRNPETDAGIQIKQKQIHANANQIKDRYKEGTTKLYLSQIQAGPSTSSWFLISRPCLKLNISHLELLAYVKIFTKVRDHTWQYSKMDQDPEISPTSS